MLQAEIVASYYAESVFIELINNDYDGSRKTQKGSFQDIQTGLRQKTRHSVRIFIAWNRTETKQESQGLHCRICQTDPILYGLTPSV